jgi:hypothetical protein
MTSKQRKRANKLLASMAHNFNHQFFGGRISPGLKVQLSPQKVLGHRQAFFDPKSNSIHIHEIFADFHGPLALTLLHEMVHVDLQETYMGQVENFCESEQDGYHGMIFQAELVRLFKAGAMDGLL